MPTNSTNGKNNGRTTISRALSIILARYLTTLGSTTLKQVNGMTRAMKVRVDAVKYGHTLSQPILSVSDFEIRLGELSRRLRGGHGIQWTLNRLGYSKALMTRNVNTGGAI